MKLWMSMGFFAVGLYLGRQVQRQLRKPVTPVSQRPLLVENQG